MVYSHIFNALANLFCLFVGIGIPLMLRIRLRYEMPIEISVSLLIIWVIICMFFLFAVLWPIGNWMYLAVFRGTSVSLSQARELSPIFNPLPTGRWYNMKQLKKLPEDERVDYLYWFMFQGISCNKIKYPKLKFVQNIMGLKTEFDTMSGLKHWYDL